MDLCLDLFIINFDKEKQLEELINILKEIKS